MTHDSSTESDAARTPIRHQPLRLEMPGVRVDLREFMAEEPFKSDLIADRHVLFGTVGGGAASVSVLADGAAAWSGPKVTGSAGFFPAGRRMRSIWPATRLTYVKLEIEPHATEELLDVGVPDAAWQTRPSADDALIAATVGHLAASLMADPADRLAALLAETLATSLHLHVARRFCGLAAVACSGSRDGLGRVLDLIHGSLPRAVSLGEMAAASNLPRARFLTAFARQTGTSPHQYILRERMARARQLLETTRIPVGQVALAVGCANAGHLTRLYQARLGSTPLAWRQRHGRT